MSQLVWDVSQRRDYDATVAYCDEAIAHGRECGDAVAVAHAELRKGFAALYSRAEIRDPRTGLNFAQAAAEQSRGVSDALYGLSLLHVGEAYAMLGEHRQCERALSAAETAFGQIDGDDPGVSFYSPTQLGRLAGSCYLFLGHPERAEPLLDATAKALHSRRKTRSLVLGNLALAYLRQRQLEVATATLHEAIDLLDDTRGGAGLTVVFGAAPRALSLASRAGRARRPRPAARARGEGVSMPTEPDAKQAIRQRVWDRLQQEGASVDPHGRIPDFVGATASAGRLAALPVWQQAHVLKANPDQAQLPVRVRALREGKLVYMAVPKLADSLPFFRLDPAELGGESEAMAAHRTAASAAPKVAVADMHTVNLIVCGSVAVNRDGVRIGKGAGYSDIEVALLAEAGLIGPPTTIVTTVHQLQVLDESLPHDEHDFTVDYIITPEEIIRCGPPHRPTGVMWTALDRDKITAIPVLAAMVNKR